MAQALIIVVDSKRIPKKDLTTFSGKQTSDICNIPSSYSMWLLHFMGLLGVCSSLLLQPHHQILGQRPRGKVIQHGTLWLLQVAHLRSQKSSKYSNKHINPTVPWIPYPFLFERFAMHWHSTLGNFRCQRSRLKLPAFLWWKQWEPGRNHLANLGQTVSFLGKSFEYLSSLEAWAESGTARMAKAESILLSSA